MGFFGSRSTPSVSDVSPVERVTLRARAAQSKESAELRRTAKRAGEAARVALLRTAEQNELDLERALTAVAAFEPTTVQFLVTELDVDDPITQFSTLGRATGDDAGLPGWLRDRCLDQNAESVVLDWLTFSAVFRAHKEFSARPADDPLPQIYEALSLRPGESLAVEGVLTAGHDECERLLRVALALRAAQRAAVARDIRSLTGYAAADAWHAFDRSNRFLTADLAEWIVAADPSPESIAAEIASGRFSSDEFTAAGRSIGISPHAVDTGAFAVDLRRTVAPDRANS